MLKSALFAMLVVGAITPYASGADEPVQLSAVPLSDRVRAAITRALPTLEAGSKGSADKRECFTCHSQAMPVFALCEAKRHGFNIDNDNLNRQLKHTHDHLQRGLANYRQGKGQGGDVLTAGYALWTLDEGNWPADEVSEAVSNYLLNTQASQQHWRHRGSRPPSSGSDFTATYVALRALHHFGADDQQAPIANRIEQVAKWLSSTPAVETEDFVFKLSSLQYVNSEPQSIVDAAAALLELQQADGGWAQNKELASDAYSTGAALSALMRDGHTPPNDASIFKGIEYLLTTQLDDGTWHVVTRAKPVQVYFESDFPHGKDQFISIAATAWATFALLQTLD